MWRNIYISADVYCANICTEKIRNVVQLTLHCDSGFQRRVYYHLKGLDWPNDMKIPGVPYLARITPILSHVPHMC